MVFPIKILIINNIIKIKIKKATLFSFNTISAVTPINTLNINFNSNVREN